MRWITLALLAGTLVLVSYPSARAVSAPTTACAANPAYHALDFTLGSWTIAGADGEPEGTSTIRQHVDGCAVIEAWSAPGESGKNIDAFDREDGRWYRMFVNSRGQVHMFAGRFRDGAMYYTGTSTEADGTKATNELVIKKNGRNRLIQRWRQSRDGGKSWQTVFLGIYTRHA